MLRPDSHEALISTKTLGAVFSAGTTSFRVWAPHATSVEVVLDASASGGFNLSSAGDGDFIGSTTGLLPGSLYQYRLDAGAAYPDPCSCYQPHCAAPIRSLRDNRYRNWTVLCFVPGPSCCGGGVRRSVAHHKSGEGVVFGFSARAALAPPHDSEWRLVWSSDDVRYGGRGRIAPTAGELGRRWRIGAEAASLLCSHRGETGYGLADDRGRVSEGGRLV